MKRSSSSSRAGIGWRGFGAIPVEKPRLRRWPAPYGERLDAEQADLAAMGKAQYVAGADGGVGAVDQPAVEADATALGQGLGQSARPDDPDEPEEFVEPQAVSHA